MPAPNNKTNRETLKALARLRLEEGATGRAVADELGIAPSTVHRWSMETTDPTEIEKTKKALTALDVDTISKTSYIQHLVLDEFIDKAHNGELTKQEMGKLSRMSVELSRTHRSAWESVNIRDGLMDPGHSTTSPATMLALLLAKATADREASARLDSERRTFEVANQPKDVIDV